jgi:proline-specific peptidase
MSEGYVGVPGGRVWYRTVGSGGGTPAIVLHGGPGSPHDYLAPLAALGEERTIAFYDQLGCGRSDRPDDPGLWRLERFVDELAAVQDALGLDPAILIGHSWGGMLAVEYALSHRQRVSALVLMSPCVSMARTRADMERLVGEMPAAVRTVIDRHHAAKTTDADQYRVAALAFYKRHLCRLEPWPASLEEAYASWGDAVYRTMWGPSEFLPEGNLRDFEAVERLAELSVPALFACGRHDEITPEATEAYRSATPGAELAVFERSAHVPHLEEPDEFLRVVRQFLAGVAPSGREAAAQPAGAASHGVADASIGERIAALPPEKLALLERRLRRDGTSGGDRIPRRSSSGPAPLSFAQERMWFLDQLQPGNPAYNIPMVVSLRSPDVAALERALAEIVARHEALRTTFSVVGGHPVQVIAPSLRVPIEVIDLRRLPPSKRAAEAARLAREEGLRPFDLATGPLFRARLVRISPTNSQLLLTLHHIVCDGWSSGIVIDELQALHDAFRQGRESPLEELPIQYADFAEWQRDWLQGETLDRQLGYWKSRLEGAPPLLELPTDKPREGLESFRGVTRSFRVPEPVAAELDRLSQREGVTLFMTLVAAFQTLLMRYSGQEDVVVGTPIAGRTRAEIEPLIGFFVNTLVLRTDLSGDPTFLELLARVKEVTLGAYAHQDLPFERLVEELQPVRRTSHNPLFQVMFTLQTLPTLDGPTAASDDDEIVEGIAKFDLTVGFARDDRGLLGSIEYATDLFEHETMARLGSHLQILLAALAEDPAAHVLDYPLLGGDELRTVLVDWAAPEARFANGDAELAALRAAADDGGALGERAHVYVLDDRRRPVPIAVQGTVYLGGPELASLRSTGQLARYRGDGSLELFGARARHAVVQGLHVALDGLEAALARHPAVRDAAVVVDERTRGAETVRAYVVPDGDATDPDLLTAELRKSLRSTLSSHLVSAEFRFLEELPRDGDGRLDELSIPSVEATEAPAFVEPRHANEAVLARIWCDVLECDRVSVNDDFFDLGGNSLAAVRMMGRVRESFGVEVSLDRLFEASTVAALAGEIAVAPRVDDGGEGDSLRTPGGLDVDPEKLSEDELDEMLLSLLATRQARSGQASPGEGAP